MTLLFLGNLAALAGTALFFYRWGFRRGWRGAIDFANRPVPRNLTCTHQGETCEECGGSLAHIVGGGVDALLCPSCDADSVHDLTEDL